MISYSVTVVALLVALDFQRYRTVIVAHLTAFAPARISPTLATYAVELSFSCMMAAIIPFVIRIFTERISPRLPFTSSLAGTWVYGLRAQRVSGQLPETHSRVVGLFVMEQKEERLLITAGNAYGWPSDTSSVTTALEHRGEWASNTVHRKDADLTFVFEMTSHTQFGNEQHQLIRGICMLQKHATTQVDGRNLWIGHFNDLFERREFHGRFVALRVSPSQSMPDPEAYVIAQRSTLARCLRHISS